MWFKTFEREIHLEMDNKFLKIVDKSNKEDKLVAKFHVYDVWDKLRDHLAESDDMDGIIPNRRKLEAIAAKIEERRKADA